MARPLPESLRPFVPSATDPWDSVKAAHLLARAGFGGTPAEISEVVSLGPERAVDKLMDFPDAPVDEQGKSGGGGPDLSMIEGYPKNFAEIRKLYQGKTEEERKKLRQELMQANRQAVGETMNWWMRRMATGPYPLHEKLVLFWHGHFTTSARDERAASLIWNQNELHRRMSAGNFRAYVKAISRDPAMLDYLNNSQNRKAHPNENYARELMELFTLGRDNGYTETDIKESARAFTGWAHDGDDFVFRKFDHDEGVKTFMGKRGTFDGDDIIEIILASKGCAPYICSRLWNFFAYEPTEADQNMLEALGQLLRDNDWELRPVLRTILTSKAFYSDRALGTQIKSPIQLVISTTRALGIDLPNIRVLMGQLNQMGQVPLAPPNVKGWPGGRLWINTSTLFVRYNTGVWLAGGDVPDLGKMKMGKGLPAIVGRARNANTNFQPAPAPSSLDEQLDTPEQVADYWVHRLIQRPIDPQKMETLVQALANDPHNPNNVRKMVQLIVSMPDYQLC
jgi:hypothetical protein